MAVVAAEGLEEGENGSRLVDLQEQLDEAGRLGLQLYEENQELHAKIEEMKVQDVKSTRIKVHDKALLDELEQSEKEINRLIQENNRLKGDLECANNEITSLTIQTKEEHSAGIKAKFQLGAMKASASFQARHLESLKASGNSAKETVETLKKDLRI